MVFDMDGDYLKEIYLGSDNGNLYGFNSFGEILDGFPFDVETDSRKLIELVSNCVCNGFESTSIVWRKLSINGPTRFIELELNVEIQLIRDKMEKLKNHLTKKIGKKDLILIEKVQNENSIGKDQNFFNVIVNEKIREGNIVACVYTGIKNDMLIAKRI